MVKTERETYSNTRIQQPKASEHIHPHSNHLTQQMVKVQMNSNLCKPASAIHSGYFPTYHNKNSRSFGGSFTGGYNTQHTSTANLQTNNLFLQPAFTRNPSPTDQGQGPMEPAMTKNHSKMEISGSTGKLAKGAAHEG